MSYRVRFTLPNGATGVWALTHPTREDAQRALDGRKEASGLAYAIEEVPAASTAAVPDASPNPTASQWPGSTAAHHVEILRAQVKELEEMVKERGKAVTDAHVANHVMHRDLALAIEIGDAMREAMRHGAWGHDGEGHLASVSAGSWDRFKTSLATAPSVPVGVPVGASEAPGEGGDSGEGGRNEHDVR